MVNISYPSENLLSHTDGWYCEAYQNNVGSIFQKNPDATEFVIDVIIEDYAENGGMDRLDLTFTKVEGNVLNPDEPQPEDSPEVTHETGINEPEIPNGSGGSGGGGETDLLEDTVLVTPLEVDEIIPKTSDKGTSSYIIMIIISVVGLYYFNNKNGWLNQ